MKKSFRIISVITMVSILAALLLCCGCTSSVDSETPSGVDASEKITITDSLGRTVTLDKHPEKVVCSNSGTLRYLTYLQAEDTIVGVDDIEKRDTIFDARPYALANPQFKTDYPLIGEFRGNDDPEKIVAAAPDVIFKTYVKSVDDADKLSDKTGIPVIALNYGNLGVSRDDMYKSLRIMGTVMDKEDRAEEVISFFDDQISELNNRTEGISPEDRKTTFIGGIAYRGPHGFQSTEPAYPPFMFVNANNVAGDMGTEHADVAKEKIVEWNPEIIFVDLSTLQTSPNAIDELKTDPAYSDLSAVKSGEVYGVLPYNWYTANHGSIITDAYYIGKILYPEQFSDIDTGKKADEVYTFLVGEPVYDRMNDSFNGQAFTKISMTD